MLKIFEDKYNGLKRFYHLNLFGSLCCTNTRGFNSMEHTLPTEVGI